MAKATVERRKVEKTITVTNHVQVYVVEMTQDEAQAVRDVLGNVGGHPEHSRRRFTETVYDALGEAGLSKSDDSDLHADVWFKP